VTSPHGPDDTEVVTTALSTLTARVAALERWARRRRRQQAVLVLALIIILVLASLAALMW
jgi:hypothetical protein